MDRQLLNRATESTDAPTPGYMYIDIAKNASASPIACQEIATFLTRKLAQKQNANIKYKCLKVITKTAESVPRGLFKRAVAQDQSAVAAIRLATNFRGPPDPVRGDEPYNKVREAAKEALDVIYSDTPATSEPSPYNSGGGGGGISNTYGAPPHGGGGGGGYGAPAGGMSGGGGPRRMEGIGNPMFSDPRLEPQPKNQFESIIKDVGEGIVGMIKDPLARQVDPPRGNMPRPGGMGGYGGPNPNAGTYGRPPPGRAELAAATGNQWTMASNRGPNAVGGTAVPPAGHNNDAYYKSRESQGDAFKWANKGSHPGSSGVGGSWASAPAGGIASQAPSYHNPQSAAPAHSAPTSSNPQNGGTAVSDGSYEKNLVLELCPPGGMKPVPPPDKLLNFAKAVPSLNADLICPVLLDCLEDGHPWIMRAKALCVMETCIQAGQRDDNTNPYANFFFTCREEIEPLTNHARAAIKDPARRVCALLGLDGGAAAPAPAAAPAAPVPNLLNFDDAPAPAPQVPPPAAPTPVAAAPSGGDMFGGMQVKAKPAATAVPDITSATSGELLDGLTGGGASAPAAQVTSMFDQLNVKASKDEEEKKLDAKDTSNDLASLAASGSAFGFINEDKSAATPAAAPPTKESFDPLLNFSPNTARQMMQMSQEQMQAMAYQQMMMQQQMQQKQYQQMQYAMAMQAAGRMPGHPMPGGLPMGHMPATQNGVMGPHAGRTSSGFSFLDNPSAKKDDKSFDFVKGAVEAEKTHK